MIEIDKLRSATSSLLERNDNKSAWVLQGLAFLVLGSPIEYAKQVVSLQVGMENPKDQLLKEMIDASR